MSSKKAWLEMVEGVPAWEISGGLSMYPFAHPDDLKDSPKALDRGRFWKIGVLIEGETNEAMALSRVQELGAEFVFKQPVLNSGQIDPVIVPPEANIKMTSNLISYDQDPIKEMVSALHFIEEGIVNQEENILVALPLDDRFFVSVAKIRGLRVLASLLREQGKSAINCLFAASLSNGLTDAYANLVALTARAVAAACTADVLLVKFGSDYSLLMQHILQLEGKLTVSNDPVAGSYYLETLTDLLGAEAWAQFKKERL